MWLSQENGNSQGTPCPQETSQSGPQKADNSLSYKFPKSARILKRSDYHRIFRTGQRTVGSVIVVDYRKGKSFSPKLGLTVSKKYGKAHQRNRFKRVTREAFRLCYHQFPKGVEMNVVPKGHYQNISTQTIVQDLVLIIQKLQKFFEPNGPC